MGEGGTGSYRLMGTESARGDGKVLEIDSGCGCTHNVFNVTEVYA